ncbi:MAG: type II secretion system F family protein [Alphaproteobacteria bacterium]|jgi:tight adherence protein C|nr:type II secretion system F family protein [Alphaproteobacteria bacterium]
MSAIESLPVTWLAAGLFLLAVVAALPGVLSLLRAAGASERIGERLRRGQGAAAAQAGSGDAKRSPVMEAVGRLAERAAPAEGREVSSIRFRLIRAGYTSPRAVPYFFAARIAGLLAPQLLLLLALPRLAQMNLPDWFPFAASGLLALAGLAGPGIWVDKKIDAKSRQCSEGFPDMMDLLVACVEAGLSLDAAVMRVSDELQHRHRELSLNLKTLALEMRAGRSRRAAWRAFADRVGLEEAGSLATMLRQAEEMGTSLGQTLRIFSTDMRQRRILLAEEKAMALPAKMTVPLILFVFPVLLGVLILPAVIRFQTIL